KGRSPASTGTTCPPPVSIEHADIRVKNYSVNSRERRPLPSSLQSSANSSDTKGDLTAREPLPLCKRARSFLSQIRYRNDHRDSYYAWLQADTIPNNFCRNYRDRQSQVLPSPISCSNNDLGAYSLHLPQDNRDFSPQFQNDESGHLYIGPLGWCRGCDGFPGLVHQIKAAFSAVPC
ncbi:interleukin 15 receptor, alpha chain, isoform CRA_f, partial [Mus musculus]